MKYLYLSGALFLYTATTALFVGAQDTSSFPNFLWTEAGANTCPTNYDPIRDAPACLSASAALGVTYSRRKNGDRAPHGQIASCFVSDVDADGHLSASRSVSRVNSDYGQQDSLLCRKARFIRQPDRSCPDDYVPITDTFTCAEAKKALHILDDPTKNGNDEPANDVACSAFVNGEEELTVERSTTPANSNQYGQVAWICERRKTAIRGRPSASMPDPDDVLRDQQSRPPYIHRRTSRPISGQAALDRLFGPSLPDYVRQKRGVDACPDRYAPITDAAACAAASAALHIENVPQFDGDWSPGDPLVCFVTNVDGHERLHNVPWPSTSRVSSNHWPDDAWICRLVQGEGGTAVAPAPSLSFLVRVSIPPVRLLGFLTLVLLLILLLSVYWFWFRHHTSKLQT